MTNSFCSLPSPLLAGHPCEETPGQLPSPLPSRSRLVPVLDGASSIPSGNCLSLNAAGGESCRAEARPIPPLGFGSQGLCRRGAGAVPPTVGWLPPSALPFPAL